MNSFKVFSFFCFILLFNLFTCFNSVKDIDEIETSVLGSRILLLEDIEDTNTIYSSDEDSDYSGIDQLVPVITLDQYRLSAKIYALIFLIYNLPLRYEYNFKIILTMILFYTAASYFRPIYLNPSHNVPTISPDRWLLTPISWATEAYLFHEDQSTVGYLVYKKPVLGLIFLLQLVLYFKAFLKRNALYQKIS